MSGERELLCDSSRLPEGFVVRCCLSTAVSAWAGGAFCSVHCVCCDEKPQQHITCAASAGGPMEGQKHIFFCTVSGSCVKYMPLCFSSLCISKKEVHLRFLLMADSAPSLCRICHSFQVSVSGREALCFHSPRGAVVTDVSACRIRIQPAAGPGLQLLVC